MLRTLKYGLQQVLHLQYCARIHTLCPECNQGLMQSHHLSMMPQHMPSCPEKRECLPRSRGEHLDRKARLVGARPSRTVLGTSREACDTRSVMTILVSQAAISHLWPFRPRTRPGKAHSASHPLPQRFLCLGALNFWKPCANKGWKLDSTLSQSPPSSSTLPKSPQSLEGFCAQGMGAGQHRGLGTLNQCRYLVTPLKASSDAQHTVPM